VIDREGRLETILGRRAGRRSAKRRIEDEDVDFRAGDLLLYRRGEGPNAREAGEVELEGLAPSRCAPRAPTMRRARVVQLIRWAASWPMPAVAPVMTTMP
jgi:hypothetical protein